MNVQYRIIDYSILPINGFNREKPDPSRMVETPIYIQQRCASLKDTCQEILQIHGMS